MAARLKHRKTSLSRFVNSPVAASPQVEPPPPGDSQAMISADVVQSSGVDAERETDEPAADALTVKPFPAKCLLESVRRFVGRVCSGDGV